MTAKCKVTYHEAKIQLGFCLFSLGFLSYIPPLTGSMDVRLSLVSLVSLALDTLMCIFCKMAVNT